MPAEIREVAFPLAVRGYSREVVDAYVERVNHVIAQLEADRSPRSAVRHALDRVGGQVGGILQRAREAADEITTAARDEAAEITARAKAEAAELVVERRRRGRPRPGRGAGDARPRPGRRRGGGRAGEGGAGRARGPGRGADGRDPGRHRSGCCSDRMRLLDATRETAAQLEARRDRRGRAVPAARLRREQGSAEPAAVVAVEPGDVAAKPKQRAGRGRHPPADEGAQRHVARLLSERLRRTRCQTRP